MAGIYLHIPFCKQACHYCDFHFSTSLKTKDKVLQALMQELENRKNYLGQATIESIYFGGGTPSILNKKELQKLLNKIKSLFVLHANIEITLECNPDDLDEEKLRELYDLGINRLSIGVQSFRNQDLKLMNRAHKSSEATASINLAKKVGFKNITIDLIYGIPGLSNSAWENNLQQAIDLNINHISSYCLTIEQGTAFGHFVKKGKLTPVDQDLAAQQYEIMVEKLIQAGFHHYEVSNFAQPHFISKHNSSYWQSKKYLGIGPSAHSFDGNSRQWNVSNNVKYIRGITCQEPYYQREIIDPITRYNEYILTGLRTTWGVNIHFISEQLKINFLDLFKKYIHHLTNSGDAILLDHTFKLTEKGLLRADGITSDFFIVQENE